MKSVVIELYKKYYYKIYAAMIFIMFAFYIVMILEGYGQDLLLRVSESKYFIKGINPYDVFIGKVDRIHGYGMSHAYSFFSYYFASVFLLFENSIWQKIIYSIIDILSLVVGIYLVEEMACEERNLTGPITIFILLISVFFWKHVMSLNYTFIIALGLILTFYGIYKNSRLLGVFGVVILGLKPSFAMPVFIYLLFSKKWNILFYSVLCYGVTLICTSCIIDTNPLDILLQIKSTQARFTINNPYKLAYTDGFFFFIKSLLGDKITAFGVLVTSAVIFLLRRYIIDPLSALILVTALGISLFYNHEHIWIIIYPLLIYSISRLFSNKIPLLPCILLLVFILTPRMARLVSPEYLYLYLAVHNIIRFGLLYVSAYLLIKNRLLKIEYRC